MVDNKVVKVSLAGSRNNYNNNNASIPNFILYDWSRQTKLFSGLTAMAIGITFYIIQISANRGEVH